MIEITGLSKVVRGDRRLDRIDLQVSAGEALLLMGTNGSGRTLLLEILATLVRPTDGRVEIDGIDVVKHPFQARTRIGYAAHYPGFHGRLSVAEHLDLMVSARGLETSRKAAVAGALVPTTLNGRERIDALSNGQLQQLEMAGAMIGEPAVLLLDEGLSQIDPLARHRFARLLKVHLEEGTSIIAACNSPNSFARLFKRVIVLHQGRILGDRKVAGDFPDPEALFADVLEGELSDAS